MDKKILYDILNKAYFSEEKHEKKIIENLPIILSNVKFFVDIGASLGQYSFYVNQYLKDGKIIAIEPDTIRFEELERNCYKWMSSSNNKLIPLNCAVSDRDGLIKFFTTKSNISGGLFKRELNSESEGDNKLIWREINVKCLRLDSICPENAPNLVKIDVEGAELRVLKGSKRILTNGNTIFLIELHGNFIDPEGQGSSDEVIDYMKLFGYISLNFYDKKLFIKLKSLQSYILWFRLKIIGIIYKFKNRMKLNKN